MNYCLYKFNFLTAVHFGGSRGGANLADSGENICADTFFSALCHEALKIGGERLINELRDLAAAGKILFSDLFPFKGEEFFLPKPFISYNSQCRTASVDIKKRKAFKKLNYIPVSEFKNYIKYIKGERDFDAEAVAAEASFGTVQLVNKVAVNGLDVPSPYYVGTYTFKNGCGLYVIVSYQEEKDLELLDRLINSLSYTGIGGKVSAGLGKFEADDCIYLDDPYSTCLETLSELLNMEKCSYFMSLTVSLPRDDELDDVLNNGYYGVIRRGGFIDSVTYSAKSQHAYLKKKDIYALSAGSCFARPFKGDIYDVSCHGGHAVYRYLKPVFVGVDL